jgi:hypothetical protein
MRLEFGRNASIRFDLAVVRWTIIGARCNATCLVPVAGKSAASECEYMEFFRMDELHHHQGQRELYSTSNLLRRPHGFER